jgi:hypothetical protein
VIAVYPRERPRQDAIAFMPAEPLTRDATVAHNQNIASAARTHAEAVAKGGESGGKWGEPAAATNAGPSWQMRCEYIVRDHELETEDVQCVARRSTGLWQY